MINEVLWHSPESNFTVSVLATIQYNGLESYILEHIILHFTNGIFKWIIPNANIAIGIQISLKYAPMPSIHNESSFVQVMAWHCRDDKAISWTNDDPLH